jgi:DNA-binding MarR family transcriptional regulator
VTDPEAEEAGAPALLSGVALAVFTLNGQVLELAEELARPAGLTAAWWQVLGAVLGTPLPVAGVAREMGITRQSVQRIADLLVERGLAEFRDNPAHRRAKLLVPTPAGRAAVHAIAPGHSAAATRLVTAMGGTDQLAGALGVLHALSAALVRLGHGREGEPAPPGADAEPRSFAETGRGIIDPRKPRR